MHITQLSLNSRDEWQLLLNKHLLLILGTDQLEERLQRFILLYSKVIEKKEEKVAYIDFRYPNGVAIKWKSNSK